MTALNATATSEPASLAVWSLLGLAFNTTTHRRRQSLGCQTSISPLSETD
jgi:hypothetical protein